MWVLWHQNLVLLWFQSEQGVPGSQSLGDVRCDACDVTCVNNEQLKRHLGGKRHQLRLQELQELSLQRHSEGGHVNADSTKPKSCDQTTQASGGIDLEQICDHVKICCVYVIIWHQSRGEKWTEVLDRSDHNQENLGLNPVVSCWILGEFVHATVYCCIYFGISMQIWLQTVLDIFIWIVFSHFVSAWQNSSQRNLGAWCSIEQGVKCKVLWVVLWTALHKNIPPLFEMKWT